jgi:hypothetical protein
MTSRRFPSASDKPDCSGLGVQYLGRLPQKVSRGGGGHDQFDDGDRMASLIVQPEREGRTPERVAIDVNSRKPVKPKFADIKRFGGEFFFGHSSVLLRLCDVIVARCPFTVLAENISTLVVSQREYLRLARIA